MNFGCAIAPLGSCEAAVRGVLAASVARDPVEDLDELIAEIDAGEATCWLISESTELLGVVVTQIVGQRWKQCVVRHCAGRSVRDWLPYLRLIEMWAESLGCNSIEAGGRPGWQSLMEPLGYVRQAVIMRKDLRSAEQKDDQDQFDADE